MSTLIIVDVQNDFATGSLATARGSEVAALIAQLSPGEYTHIIATQDWHIDPGTHFSETPDYIDTWPVHCRAESEGAQLCPALADYPIEAFFHKGAFDAAYSGFEGVTAKGIGLGEWLNHHEVDSVDVVGIATDYCVRATVLDALKAGLKVRVLKNLCAPVDENSGAAAFVEMQKAGAQLI